MRCWHRHRGYCVFFFGESNSHRPLHRTSFKLCYFPRVHLPLASEFLLYLHLLHLFLPVIKGVLTESADLRLSLDDLSTLGTLSVFPCLSTFFAFFRSQFLCCCNLRLSNVNVGGSSVSCVIVESFCCICLFFGFAFTTKAL